MAKISQIKRPTVTPRVTPRHPVGNRGELKLFATFDMDTGEEVGRYVSDGRRLPDPNDWIRIYQSFAAELAANQDPLSPLENRAVWMIVAKAGFGNQAYLNLSEIAREWCVSRKSVSQAFSEIVRRRIAERAKGGAYRLNPNFAWKGDTEFRAAWKARWLNKELDARHGALPPLIVPQAKAAS